MIINHNIAALNTHRQLSANTAATSKNIEKLSSGLRINRAGDDAAGLAISEKMRGQIRGLDMASKNSQDGISLIQTAEGALNETHSILQRMRELAVQSSSDTNTDTDRGEIQKEMGQLVEEIDRISSTTEFNTKKLLDGSFKGTFQIGANEGQKLELNITTMKASDLGLTSSVTVKETGTTADATKLSDGTYTVKGGQVLDSSGNAVAKYDATNGKITSNDATAVDIAVFAKTGTLVDGSTITISNKGANFEAKNNIVFSDAKGTTKLSAGTYSVSGTNLLKDNVLVGKLDGTAGIELNDGTKVAFADLGFKAQLADKDSFTINGSDVSSRQNAQGTITTVDQAIQKVSAERSKLGAVQNRLEHTINNLNASSENLTAAESRVRDVDMAKEMMNQTKNNILAQAAQAMLAQANQQPQGVLQLLR